MSDELSPKAQLRLWIREEIEGKEEVEIPAVTERIVDRMLKNRKLLSDYVRTNLAPIVYEEARRVVGETRELVLLGDSIEHRGTFQERSRNLRRTWGNWLEHVGDRNKLLMKMDGHDLEVAASERRKRMTTEGEIADLWDALRARLKPGQVVGDVFTPEHIEAVRVSLKKPALELVPAT